MFSSVWAHPLWSIQINIQILQPYLVLFCPKKPFSREWYVETQTVGLLIVPINTDTQNTVIAIWYSVVCVCVLVSTERAQKLWHSRVFSLKGRPSPAILYLHFPSPKWESSYTTISIWLLHFTVLQKSHICYTSTTNNNTLSQVQKFLSFFLILECVHLVRLFLKTNL